MVSSMTLLHSFTTQLLDCVATNLGSCTHMSNFSNTCLPSIPTADLDLRHGFSPQVQLTEEGAILHIEEYGRQTVLEGMRVVRAEVPPLSAFLHSISTSQLQTPDNGVIGLRPLQQAKHAKSLRTLTITRSAKPVQRKDL